MNNDLKLEVSKHFSETTEKLFAAWTEGEQLKIWWKPMNNSLIEIGNDLKQGGAVKYVFETGLIISGNYEEVLKNEKLVYSWNWNFPKDEIKNAFYKLSVTFMAEDEGSTINILQTSFENEESILPHKEGWEKGLNDLAKYFSNENK